MEGIVPIRDISTDKLIGVKFSRAIKNHSTLNKATLFSRSYKNPTKGMSAWDLDDTLARTKSGVRARIPNPDMTPQSGRRSNIVTIISTR